MDNVVGVIVLGVAGLGIALATVFWLVGGRSIAASRGWVRPQCDDFLVQAWNAERAEQWDDALAAYNKALGLDPWSPDARARLENLLQSHPELADSKAGREALKKLTRDPTKPAW
jgi:hypothetical protein